MHDSLLVFYFAGLSAPSATLFGRREERCPLWNLEYRRCQCGGGGGGGGGGGSMRMSCAVDTCIGSLNLISDVLLVRY